MLIIYFEGTNSVSQEKESKDIIKRLPGTLELDAVDECLIPASLSLVLKNHLFTVISNPFILAFPMHVSSALSPSTPRN